MSYKSHVAGPSRIFDHLYDPMYVTSGKRDIWRANCIALANSAPVHVMSVYSSMFSDIPTKPSFRYWKQQNPLPHFPYKEETGWQTINGLSIEGKARWKYFYYSPMNTKTVNIRLDMSPDNKDDVLPKPCLQTVACQTAYRESSAQTRPYMPEAVLTDGQTEAPELFQVANLITGDNLPGDFEAKIINRARKRRQWESKLPTAKTLRDWDKRRVVLEAFEWEEWMAREEEIQNCQSLRLDLVARLMKNRESRLRFTSSAKLRMATERINLVREKEFANLNKARARALRKLELKHKRISSKYQPVDIISEHLDYASDLYAPQMRYGKHPRRRHFTAFKSSFTSTLDDFEKRVFNSTNLKCQMSKNDRLSKPKERSKEITRGFRTEKHLTRLYESLRLLRDKKLSSKTTPKCMEQRKTEYPLPPETPVGVEEDVVAESEFQCCVLLQKIIKGRAIQNILYNGRDKCRGLIQELQLIYPLSTFKNIQEAKNIIHRRPVRHGHTEPSKKYDEKEKIDEAPAVSFLLNFLESELQRLNDERKIQALCMLARRERIKREAREGAKNKENDQIYRTFLESSYDTVGKYLESVLLQETDGKSHNEAKKEIKSMAKRVDREVSRVHFPKDNEKKPLKTLNVVTTPDKGKFDPNLKMEIKQKIRLSAAHNALFGDTAALAHRFSSKNQLVNNSGAILNDLIYNVLLSEEMITQIQNTENLAHHEAFEAVRNIIGKIFPSESSKSESYTTSEDVLKNMEIKKRKSRGRLTRSAHVEETSHPEYEWLNEIIDDINEKLWEYAFEETESKNQSEDKRSSPVNISIEDGINPVQEKLDDNPDMTKH